MARVGHIWRARPGKSTSTDGSTRRFGRSSTSFFRDAGVTRYVIYAWVTSSSVTWRSRTTRRWWRASTIPRCATKGGVSSLSRTLALAKQGIRVNTIVPGATETPLMWAGVPEEEVEATRETIEGRLAIGRLAEPAEIAEGVVWLLSDASSYATGSHLTVDGGLGATANIAT
jgi:NAD(P)-dependent dehydrogenase (short-subunit alcohol dehydrogenase family)